MTRRLNLQGKLAGCLALAATLAACAPQTAIDLTYADGAGKTIEASYQSDKDITAPTFRLSRDADGNVQDITLGAGSSLGSPLIEQQAALWAQLAPLISATTAATIDALVRAGLIVAAPGAGLVTGR